MTRYKKTNFGLFSLWANIYKRKKKKRRRAFGLKVRETEEKNVFFIFVPWLLNGDLLPILMKFWYDIPSDELFKLDNVNRWKGFTFGYFQKPNWWDLAIFLCCC